MVSWIIYLDAPLAGGQIRAHDEVRVHARHLEENFAHALHLWRATFVKTREHNDLGTDKP